MPGLLGTPHKGVKPGEGFGDRSGMAHGLDAILYDELQAVGAAGHAVRRQVHLVQARQPVLHSRRLSLVLQQRVSHD